MVNFRAYIKSEGKKQSSMKKIVYLMVIALTILFIGCPYVVPTFGDYSSGTRVGMLQKFSKKGVMFKTLEGELAMEGIRSQGNGKGVSSIFEFSVMDDRIANQLDTLVGKTVELTYKQKLFVNRTEGETSYIVVAVMLKK